MKYSKEVTTFSAIAEDFDDIEATLEGLLNQVEDYCQCRVLTTEAHYRSALPKRNTLAIQLPQIQAILAFW